MESSSPIHSFSFDAKCSHILEIATISIDIIESIKTFLPLFFIKSTIPRFLLVDISLFSWPKKSSTGAISGVYCGKYTQAQSVFAKHIFYLSRSMYGTIVQYKAYLLFVDTYNFLHIANKCLMYSIKVLELVAPFLIPVMIIPFENNTVISQMDPLITIVDAFHGIPFGIQ